MIRRPPRSTRTDTLLPYTTLFRSAQLPLTRRDAASAVTFVAGQCKGLTDQDWSGLAGKGRTLVIYMGVATAEDIADKLMADGVSPATPVAVLEKGTRADGRAMRTLRSEERRVGKECVSTCRSRWSPYHEKKKKDPELTARRLKQY